jgi:uncharacterized protein
MGSRGRTSRAAGRTAGLCCPTCDAAVPAASPRPSHFPFCSARCQLVDLGKWLDEAYRVSEPAERAHLPDTADLGDRDD